VNGNWRWRLAPGQLTEDLLVELAGLTAVYQRGPQEMAT